MTEHESAPLHVGSFVERENIREGLNPRINRNIAGHVALWHEQFVLLLLLMPPVRHSQIEAHEIHRGNGVDVCLSLALALSTIQVTV
ncbi:hypothetical protein TNCV_4655431 [Trichonephila clavipes]|nr:hypothetical protein TNCV_4655431 [Trichonephila clavipes]